MGVRKIIRGGATDAMDKVLHLHCVRMALKHGSFAVHWLTHAGVNFQASINSRVIYVEPFSCPKVMVQTCAWSVVMQREIRRAPY